jgi:hypothetical protein
MDMGAVVFKVMGKNPSGIVVTPPFQYKAEKPEYSVPFAQNCCSQFDSLSTYATVVPMKAKPVVTAPEGRSVPLVNPT